MTVSEGTALGALVVAVFSFVASAAAVVLQLRERVSPQRAALYQRKLEVAEACLRSVLATDGIVRRVHTDPLFILPERLRGHHSDLEAADKALGETYGDYLLFLPQSYSKYIEFSITLGWVIHNHRYMIEAFESDAMTEANSFGEAASAKCILAMNQANDLSKSIADEVGIELLGGQLRQALEARK